jgi:hypothetical protein
MVFKNNRTFRELLALYNLPDDFSFPLELPEELKTLLDAPIVQTDRGLTLAPFETNDNTALTGADPAVIEDDANHFHVDWYIDPPDSRQAFMLGVKTIHLLAQKFAAAGIAGMRFVFSFQTPEQGEAQALAAGIHEAGDVYFISDRLSFYKNKDNNIFLPPDAFDPYAAVLWIEL